MSSPEAHSRTPHSSDIQPSLNEYLGDQGGYAYGAETEDGDASPEVRPLDPDVIDYYESPRTPEEQEAREVIHGPLRAQADRAVTQAIADAWRDQQLIELGIKPLEPKIKKQEEKVETAHKKWSKEDEMNAAKGRLSSRKQRALKRKEYQEAAKQRKLEKSKKRINDASTEPLAKQTGDTLRQTEAYKSLLIDVQAVDEEIRTRNEMRALVDDPATPDDRKAFFRERIASWGGQTDEQYRNERLTLARDAYENALNKKAYEESVEPFKKAVGTGDEPGPILERAKMVKQLERATDPAEIARLNIALAKSYDQFVREQVGDVDGFKNWVHDSALLESRDALRAAARDIINMRKELKKQEATAEELLARKRAWEGADAATKEENPWADSNDDRKLTKALDDINKSKEAIIETHDSQMRKIKKTYNSKLDLARGL